jgi:hypothetical protein
MKRMALVISLAPMLALAQANGTSLSATATVVTTTCVDETSATVVIDSTLTSTGAVNPAQITRDVDSGAQVDWVGEIRPQDFGPGKVANFTDTLTLRNGTHVVCYTFTQAGAGGNQSKQATACATATVACTPAASTCPTTAFFGGIVKSPLVCNKNGTPTIPIHLKANANGVVTLSVTGPGTFGFQVDMNRSGDSCVYQYNDWSAKNGNHGGAGTYTFTARDDDGELATVSAEWNCP